jgi:cytochrome c oxidase subunit IV
VNNENYVHEHKMKMLIVIWIRNFVLSRLSQKREEYRYVSVTLSVVLCIYVRACVFVCVEVCKPEGTA